MENKHKLINLINNFYKTKNGVKRFKDELEELKEDVEFHSNLTITNSLKELILDYCNSKWKDEIIYNNEFINFIFIQIL